MLYIIHLKNKQTHKFANTLLTNRTLKSQIQGNRFGLEGLAIEYLKLLEKDEDLNFKCKAMHILGKNESVGFTNFVTRLNNCTNNTAETDSDDPVCKCELATGGWSITDYRFGKVDYLPPFVPDGLSVVIRMDSLMSGTTGPFFLAAFSPLVWLYIFGLMVLFAFLKMLDHRFTENLSSSTSLPASESRISRFFHTLYKSNFSRLARQALKSVCKFPLPFCWVESYLLLDPHSDFSPF